MGDVVTCAMVCVSMLTGRFVVWIPTVEGRSSNCAWVVLVITRELLGSVACAVRVVDKAVLLGIAWVLLLTVNGFCVVRVIATWWITVTTLCASEIFSVGVGVGDCLGWVVVCSLFSYWYTLRPFNGWTSRTFPHKRESSDNWARTSSTLCGWTLMARLNTIHVTDS